jgi:small-conductance mechanosensitive channel
MRNSAELLTLNYYLPLMFNLVRIGFILIFAWLATTIAERLIRGLKTYTVRMMLKAGGGSDYELEKRAQTIGAVLRKSLAILIWAVAIIMILKELNFDVRPLIAGAGIAGVAVGLGAQSVVKDIIGGLFLLVENQIRVNDVVVINGANGLVEEINLRTTVLRGEDGAVHVFPNGGIQTLSNLTREYSFYMFTISVDYNHDPDRVMSVLREIGAELMEEEPYKSAVLAPIEVLGVDRLADSGSIVKARIKTLPVKQWIVGREMNRRIQKRFKEAGISVPFPTQTLVLPDKFSPGLKNELKQIVREVIEERAGAS